MSLLSIHCQPGTAFYGRQNHHYCGGERGPGQPCYCPHHFPAPARTWECNHAPRLDDSRPLSPRSQGQLRAWAKRARFSLVSSSRLP